MSVFTRLMAACLTPFLIVTLVSPVAAQSQPAEDAWRTLAQRLDVGSRIKLRLQDGQRVSATLISAGADDIVVQPRTRVPVGVQHVPYREILTLERDEPRGMNAAKAAAIGVGAGAGTVLAVMMLLIAAWD